MRVLIDTNIVLDFVLRRTPFFAEANEIIIRLQNLEFEGFVTAITLINTFYTTKKELDRQIAFNAVRAVLSFVEVCNSDKPALRTALALEFSDFEDAAQCASAVAAGLDAIVTRNTKDFENSPITVYSPSEFLDVLDPAPEVDD